MSDYKQNSFVDSPNVNYKILKNIQQKDSALSIEDSFDLNQSIQNNMTLEMTNQNKYFSIKDN